MYPDGVDTVWIGVDGFLNVAAFVTGGSGPIPDIWLAQGGLHEEVEDLIYSFPIVGDAEMLVEVKRPDDFIAMAQRGLYVFDWTDVYRVQKERCEKYEPVARPRVPISLSMLPPIICELASECRFDRVNFSEIKDISVEFGSGFIGQR